ncbi:MAG TPA: hypothetical protein PLG90_06045 [Ignavibacteria bacterium]|nr:hypothetical protein [Ignavibacteria bacterium]
MDKSEIKKGSCPTCKSNNIYSNKNNATRGERSTIAISSFKWFRLDTYVCLNCGYFAEFIKEEDLNNSKTTDKIKQEWDLIR